MMTKPQKTDFKMLRDITIGIILLLSVSAFSVYVGLFFSETQLGNWGQWIGAFIAGIAMVGSSYAIILQSQQGESIGWNIALSRLGEIYDQACMNERFATIINQVPDSDWKINIDPDDIILSPSEDIWLGSLFLAFEQIFVATKGLSGESKRVWRLYIRNQLNKPYIRATFVKDATVAKDYHQEFWRFVRGKPDKKSPEGYINYAIHPKYFQKSDNVKSNPLLDKNLIVEPFSKAHAGFWLSLYQDEEVKNQMYSAPTSNEDELVEYLSDRKVFTVLLENTPVGGFTITMEKDHLASVGFVLHPEFRGKGLGRKILDLLEIEARNLGVYTLRADVYADNRPSIRSLESSGFRKFLWLEKNITNIEGN